MSDAVIITLIVACVVVLIAYKDKITSLFFKANNDGIEGGMKADKSTGVTGNLLVGVKNKLRVKDKRNVQGNKLLGADQEIIVQPSSPAKKAAKK